MPPIPAPRLSLPLTTAALARYDAKMVEFNALLEGAIEKTSLYGVLADINQLGAEVGEAFGQDTSDRNDPAACRALVRPDLWLRNLVAKYGAGEPPCGNRTCAGWAHMNGYTRPSVQRCDECSKYPDDNAAQVAHDRECPYGAQCSFRGAQP